MATSPTPSATSPDPKKEPSGMQKFQVVIYTLTSLLLATGSVIWAVTDTPPRRAANEYADIQLRTEQEKTKQIELQKKEGVVRIELPPPWPTNQPERK